MEPPTEPGYGRDPYRRELDTEVREAGEEGGRPFVVLADTLCYPEGGGQPADRGTLGAAAVVDVRRRGGAVRHYLDRPLAPGPVRLELDWERRFDHMQHHTGQHLLTAVAAGRFGWPTTAFHLGDELADVELDVPRLDGDDLDRLEEAVAAEIRQARPVRPRWVSPDEYLGLEVRSRGLPPDHRGDIRLVEIEGVDLNTCGGTHLRSTAEIEALALVATERLRGGTRLFFVAGRRLRRRLGRHERRTAELRTLLGAGDDGLVQAVRGRLGEEREGARRERALRDELGRQAVQALAGGAATVVGRHFPALDLPSLQKVGRELLAALPERAVVLTAGAGDGGSFVVALGDEVALDPAAAAAVVAEVLGGRGGGRDRFYQGKCAHPERCEAAVAALRERLG
jgi:Ser-tRNA(Ala) deacylase AlaX